MDFNQDASHSNMDSNHKEVGQFASSHQLDARSAIYSDGQTQHYAGQLRRNMTSPRIPTPSLTSRSSGSSSNIRSPSTGPSPSLRDPAVQTPGQASDFVPGAYMENMLDEHFMSLPYGASSQQQSFMFAHQHDTQQANQLASHHAGFDRNQFPFNSGSSLFGEDQSLPPESLSMQPSIAPLYRPGSSYSPVMDSQNLRRDRSSSNSKIEEALSNREYSPQNPLEGRRRSNPIEADSARAIYLEKNRKAANKCRVKQRKQQDELVEQARVMERQNKMLKQEVQMLKNDMRNLMELVGKHSLCPDQRLKTYVQREADRLAGAGVDNPFPEEKEQEET